MRKLFIMVPVLALLLSAAVTIRPIHVPAENVSSEVSLSMIQLPDADKTFTPGRQKKQLIASLDLPNGEGRGIRCSVSQQGVMVDTDLDGTPDTRVVVNNKLVELAIRREEGGKKLKYWIVISFDPRFVQRQWFYETATAVTGTVDGKKIMIVDDNCNANFADFGTDGLIVAPSKAGWYLSSTVDTGKSLVEIDVDPNGTSLSYKPFFGETGTIDPFSKLTKARYAPMVFVVKQSDRSFNVIRPDGKPSIVPIGTYNIERGVLDRLTEFVGAKHPPFDVLKDNTTAVEWGGPFTFLFGEKPTPDHPMAQYGIDPNTHVFICEPPYVKGEKGEVYVGSKLTEVERPLESPFGERKEFFIAEQMAFNVEIVDLKTKKACNGLKFYTGGQPPPQPEQPAPYYWLVFSYQYGDRRGKYLLRVTSPQSRNFKEAIFESPIELK